ncbi:MAG: sugar phosphate isomerase/epimerase, partial [Planctomycetes bacterium]|nr:sugar phosphate isomerase/epimerase [Planctomycetota bacterium]
RHLSRFLSGLGLDVAALVADVPGTRLTDPASTDERIDRTRLIMELARDLGVGVVTASVGSLTHPETGEPSPLALDALRQIGEHADMIGTTYAIRPLCETALGLARVLDEVGCPSISICLDPAAMVMSGVNPLPVLERFADSLSIVHVRDGTAGGAHSSGTETRLGEGDVDLAAIISGLVDAEFGGVHILRRTDSRTPEADLEAGRDVLATYM